MKCGMIILFMRGKRMCNKQKKISYASDGNLAIPGSFFVFIFIASMVLSCSALNHMFKVDDDHVLEELSESIIKNETGLDIDLTPESPEKSREK